MVFVPITLRVGYQTDNMLKGRSTHLDHLAAYRFIPSLEQGEKRRIFLQTSHEVFRLKNPKTT